MYAKFGCWQCREAEVGFQDLALAELNFALAGQST